MHTPHGNEFYVCPVGYEKMMRYGGSYSNKDDTYIQIWDKRVRRTVSLKRFLLDLVPGDGLIGNHIDLNKRNYVLTNLNVRRPL